jgi:hypothetical protein
MTRRYRHLAIAACLSALATAAIGCGTAAPARPPAAAVTAPSVPLNTSVTTAAGTWATAVMGGSATQHNNFWQLFVQPSGSTQWKLVTPPGTADNGGLVLAAGAGPALITAFRPSQLLTFTPLVQTRDLGRTWSALSPLGAALASTPDSLAAQPGTGKLLALLDTGTAEQGSSGGGRWTTLVTVRALASTQAGKSCSLQALTAVAYTSAGTPLLAGTCARAGTAGIFADTGHGWQAAGPALPGQLSHRAVTVLQLGTADNQTTALLALGTGAHASLVTAWLTANGTSWTTSPPLATGGHAVAATSLGPGETAAVITAGGHGALLSQGHWQLLPALPPGTVALAPSADGTTDALAVHRATLTVWHLASQQGSWTRAQTLSVPIQYGSSG